tara:strand:+ start:10379 stop:11734 length:1356 start_codon:yes stop_codon:yes gene_type:complete
MFKKIEVWVLYLAVILMLFFTIFVAILVRQELVGTKKLGIVSEAALFLSEIPVNLIKALTDPLEINLRMNESKPRLNILSNENREEFLLLSRYDGNKDRSVIEIVDINNFDILHTYEPNLSEINIKADTDKEIWKNLKRDNSADRGIVVHPIVLNDGSLIIKGDSPVSRIDFCSNLIWVNDKYKFHHSTEMDHENNLWIPSEEYPHSINEKYVSSDFGSFKNDAITKINPEGEILYHKTIMDIFLENRLENLVYGLGVFNRDPFHINDIEPALFNGPFWNKGDIFLSLRNISLVLQYRPETGKVIKYLRGPFFYQHDIDIISENKISIYNNNLRSTGHDGEGKNKIALHNEILLYDFETDQFSKLFNDKLIYLDIKSPAESLADFAKDGAVLIEEHDYGRIVFLNKNGDLIWEFVNKSDNGKVYQPSWSRLITDEMLLKKLKSIIKGKKCD